MMLFKTKALKDALSLKRQKVGLTYLWFAWFPVRAYCYVSDGECVNGGTVWVWLEQVIKIENEALVFGKYYKIVTYRRKNEL
jgi:hypothetical protein